eukprot:2408092-Pyramimonas_sp.AAC.1
MVRRVFQKVEDAVDGGPLQPISAHDIRVALKQMKASTGQGIDFLSPVDLERLPDTGLAELALLYTACEACLRWPGQLPLILGRAPPEKVHKFRIIGLVPLLGRLWSLIREPL